MGIPVVALTATTSTAFFASLGKSLDSTVVLFCGLVSIISSVLAALQTFLRFAERSEQHRVAAAWYSNLAKDMEYVLAKPAADRGDAAKTIEAWKVELASLAEQSPVVAPQSGRDPAEIF